MHPARRWASPWDDALQLWWPDHPMQFLNTLTVLALVVMSFALIVAVPVLYASSEDSGRSNRLILLGSAVWVALVLLNWGVSFFVV
jgi:photosystem II PsbZ protein|tara:strand:+ start:39 stop:296 length:258 start_codon:yes stop_codon:yes gene_type:complete